MVALHSGNFEQVIFAFGQLKLRATSPNRGKPFAAIGCRINFNMIDHVPVHTGLDINNFHQLVHLD
jgi:hypothetical protein